MTLLINDQPSTSNDDCKHFPVADLLAHCDGQLFNLAIERCCKWLLRFHRFQHEHLLTFRHRIALLHKYVHDLTGHRRTEFAASCRASSAGSRLSRFDHVNVALIRDVYFVAGAHGDCGIRSFFRMNDHAVRQFGNARRVWVELDLFSIDVSSQQTPAVIFLFA